MYWIASALMALLLVTLYLSLPQEEPRAQISYPRLLRSLWDLLLREPVLHEVSLFGGLAFGAFQLFWVTLTFFLSTPLYHFNSDLIGLFGLVGVVGAVTATLVGKLADRGNPRAMTGLLLAVMLVTYLVFWLAGQWLWGLIIGVILLDLGTQGAHISNQTRIYARPQAIHSRLNTVYMFSYFIGGSLGSALGTYAWQASRRHDSHLRFACGVYTGIQEYQLIEENLFYVGENKEESTGYFNVVSRRALATGR